MQGGLAADGDVTHLLGENELKELGRGRVAGLAHPADRDGSHVASMRLKCHVFHRQPRENVTLGLLRHLPETSMRRQGAVVRAELTKPRGP